MLRRAIRFKKNKNLRNASDYMIIIKYKTGEAFVWIADDKPADPNDVAIWEEYGPQYKIGKRK
jgi:hypothetical protein